MKTGLIVENCVGWNILKKANYSLPRETSKVQIRFDYIELVIIIRLIYSRQQRKSVKMMFSRTFTLLFFLILPRLYINPSNTFRKGSTNFYIKFISLKPETSHYRHWRRPGPNKKSRYPILESTDVPVPSLSFTFFVHPKFTIRRRYADSRYLRT